MKINNRMSRFLGSIMIVLSLTLMIVSFIYGIEKIPIVVTIILLIATIIVFKLE